MWRLLVRVLGPLVAVLDAIFPFKLPRQDTELPEEAHVPAASSTQEEINKALEDLVKGKEVWAQLGNQEKADLLRRCLLLLKKHLRAIAGNAAARKGTYENGLGEEMLVLVPAALALDDFEKLLRGGPVKCLSKKKVGDRWICDVFPRGMDNMLLSGTVGQIWIKPGHEPTQGAVLEKHRKEAPGIACILAAGNHFCVAMRDTLQQLVVNNKACVVKLNPVNDWIGADMQTVLQPLVDIGAVRCLYGATAVAEALVSDERVAVLHMTGSTATYNAIVWGNPKGPTGGPRLVSKPFEAELGCVTPHIVIPSKHKWSQGELEYHAKIAVTACMLNSGHNCLSTELIVTAKGWSQREQFVQAVRKVLSEASQRWPWYPGSAAKMAAFKEKFPNAEELGVGICTMARCTQPYLLATNVAPADASLQHENWCPVLQEVPLDTPLLADGSVNVPEFLNAAADFCNGSVFGTLSCSMSIHPVTERRHSYAFEAFLGDLKYGSIIVNGSTNLGVTFTTMPWGAWAAAGTPEDIGTGNVQSHTGVYDHLEKGVMRCPWRIVPTPLFFADNSAVEISASNLLAFFTNRNLLTLSPVIVSALRAA